MVVSTLYKSFTGIALNEWQTPLLVSIGSKRSQNVSPWLKALISLLIFEKNTCIITELLTEHHMHTFAKAQTEIMSNILPKCL